MDSPFLHFDREKALHKEFLQTLHGLDVVFYKAYTQALLDPANVSPKEESLLISALALFLEDFLANLFNIKEEIHFLREKNNSLAPIFYVQRQFVQRYALKRGKIEDLENFDPLSCVKRLDLDPKNVEFEVQFAKKIQNFLQNEVFYKEELYQATLYTLWAMKTDAGQKYHAKSLLFRTPKKTDYDHLLDFTSSPPLSRNGFSLTDRGLTFAASSREAHYCIYCHHQGKDSCQKGLKSKHTPDLYEKNPLGISLKGCPLEQKISEMNELKSKGYILGALAIAMVDNPLIPATGHRICNDCKKACIFQKQDSVDVPGIETEILESVLNLPYGVEIYLLLTRWNPLNLSRPLLKEPTHKKILVVGAGPAGFTLAYHLLQDGHTVVLVDGTRIEPAAHPGHIISSWKAFQEDLDTRMIQGFGGVMEYGITVRWNKNYLKLIRIVLERYKHFLLKGGIRFGGTLTVDQAFEDFDHIALCMGAGKPNILEIPHGLAKGVRYASDFLMALQLTGAFQRGGAANLDIDLPVVVLGGGLTAVDTATEALSYYPRFVQKMSDRFQKLSHLEQKKFLKALSFDEKKIFSAYLMHHSIFENERTLAIKECRSPNFTPYLNTLGGVTIVYRKALQDSPAYRLNHEEVQHAINQGIKIQSHSTPLRFEVDVNYHVTGVWIKNGLTGGEEFVSARTVLIAVGTNPNTNLIHDEPHKLSLQEKWLAFENPLSHPPFIVYKNDKKKAMTMFGDMHPNFEGNVVKAMASAKYGYPVIGKLLLDPEENYSCSMDFLHHMDEKFTARVVSVTRISPTQITLVIKSPMAAQNFRKGQHFKLQNFKTQTFRRDGMIMEPLALTGIDADLKAETISFLVHEKGASSHICHTLIPGEPVVLMGPTGKDADHASHLIYSSMQCMLKGVCGQCLQKAKDPTTGKEHYLFMCTNPHQERLIIDKITLEARLRQNTLGEKLMNLANGGHNRD